MCDEKDIYADNMSSEYGKSWIKIGELPNNGIQRIDIGDEVDTTNCVLFHPRQNGKTSHIIDNLEELSKINPAIPTDRKIFKCQTYDRSIDTFMGERVINMPDIFREMSYAMYQREVCEGMKHHIKIRKVIFNDPATIVFWSDNTKTVVLKQDKDKKKKFDKEKGLAIAIAKKFLGNEGNYYNEFRKWCE